MILITGGAYQGKTAFAAGLLGIAPEDMADGRVCTPEEALSAGCINSFHALVRRMPEPGLFTEELCRRNAGAVVIMDEIGCGIVPMDPFERKWREECGLFSQRLAACSKVIRVVCGKAFEL